MAVAPSRRQLVFRDLDEMIREVDALHAGGYQPSGRWNLAQVCGHLADWMAYPLDGYPRPFLLRPLFWAIRNTIGRRQLRHILETRSMPSGVQTLKQTIPAPNLDESMAIERLRRTIRRFKEHRGPLHPSPLFGAMSNDEVTQLQLIHGAHHLGFLRRGIASHDGTA